MCLFCALIMYIGIRIGTARGKKNPNVQRVSCAELTQNLKVLKNKNGRGSLVLVYTDEENFSILQSVRDDKYTVENINKLHFILSPLGINTLKQLQEHASDYLKMAEENLRDEQERIQKLKKEVEENDGCFKS